MLSDKYIAYKNQDLNLSLYIYKKDSFLIAIIVDDFVNNNISNSCHTNIY